MKTSSTGFTGLTRSHAWPRVRLGDVCEEVRDRIPSSDVSVSEYVTTDNMVKERGGVVDAEYVPENVGLVNYETGDVLIANIRPYLKKIWLADKYGGCSSDVVVFRSSRKDLSAEYLYAVLSQDGYFDYVMLKPRGTKMPRGDRDWMKQFEFPLPPLSVQREIVARLEKELAAVDKMEAGFKAMAEAADAEFKATLKETFEGLEKGEDGTTGTDGTTGVVGSRVPRDRGHAGRVPLPAVKRVKLGEVCEKIIDCPHTTAKDEGSGIPLVRTPNIGMGKLLYENMHRVSEAVYIARTARGVPCEGDLIFAREAPAGNIAVIQRGEKVCLGQRTVLLKPLRKIVDSGYLAYLILSPQSQKQLLGISFGSTVQHVNVADIRNFMVNIVDLSAQRAIVARLDTARSRCEKLKAAAEKGAETAAVMRKAILKEAFE